MTNISAPELKQRAIEYLDNFDRTKDGAVMKALGNDKVRDLVASLMCAFASRIVNIVTSELTDGIAAALVDVRREAIEECAQAANRYAEEAERNCRNERGPTENPWSAANRVATRIRALIDKEPAP